MRIILALFLIGAVIAACVDLWVGLGLDGAVTVHLWPLARQIDVPPILLPVLGATVVALIVMFRSELRRSRLHRSVKPEDAATGSPVVAPGPAADLTRWSLGYGMAVGTSSLLIIFGVLHQHANALASVTLLLCASITFVALVFALDALRREQAIEFSSYWGGLGGSIGGWRLSPVTTTIIVVLIFLAATITIGTQVGPNGDKPTTRPASASNNVEDGNQIVSSAPAAPDASGNAVAVQANGAVTNDAAAGE